jgi:hypothetical protein
MTRVESKKFDLIRGTLTELSINDAEVNLVSDVQSTSAGGIAVGLATAGLAGAATNALLAEAGARDNVQTFSATVAGERIVGCVSKVSFRDGDEVECAIDRQPDGTLVAYAIRRPTDRTVWMFPHCSRGRRKHWLYALKMAAIVSFAITGSLWVWLLAGLDFALDHPHLYFPATIYLIMGLLLGTHLSLNTARRWMPFVTVAESVFAAFGYRNASAVDLGADDKLYWKRNPDEQEQRLYHPWVFRYLDH